MCVCVNYVFETFSLNNDIIHMLAGWDLKVGKYIVLKINYNKD